MDKPPNSASPLRKVLHIFDIEGRKYLSDTFCNLWFTLGIMPVLYNAFVQKGMVGIDGYCKSIRDVHPLFHQLFSHLSQGGILTSNNGKIVEPNFIKP